METLSKISLLLVHFLLTIYAPLIEDFPGDSSYKLVTFLWKDSEVDTINTIALKIWPRVFFPLQQYLDKCQRQKIPGSHTWFKIFNFRNDALFSYQFLINDKMQAIVGFKQEDWAATMGKFVPDPYNKQRYSTIDGESSVWRLLTTEDSKNYYSKKTGTKEGLITSYTYKSKIFQNERGLWVYTPAGYNSAKRYPLYMFLDGREKGISGGMPVATILDNLIAENKISPGIAMLIGNAEGARVKDFFTMRIFRHSLLMKYCHLLKNNIN